MMPKYVEYQRFVVLMRPFTDRPVFLRGMFDRGLTLEEAKEEMAGLQRNGARMFKVAISPDVLDQPTVKDRIVTLDAMQRLAAGGARRQKQEFTGTKRLKTSSGH